MTKRTVDWFRPIPRVWTPNGFVLIPDLTVGSLVYDRSGQKTLEVRGVYEKSCREYAIITYTDGLQVTVPQDAMVVNGYEIEPLTCAMNHKSFAYIPMPTVQANPISNPIPIDPYLLGVLLTYGDQNTYEVTIPYQYIQWLEPQLNQAGYLLLDPMNTRGAHISTTEFPEKPLAWHRFIPRYMQSGWNYQKIYPNEILRMPKEHRMKFLQGIFDRGDLKIQHDGSIQYTYTDPLILCRIYQLLRSVGVCSEISYAGNGTYWLLIHPKEFSKELSLIFNERVNIYQEILTRLQYLPTSQVFDHDWGIQSIKLCRQMPFQHPMIFYQLELDQPHGTYLTDFFTPMVGC